jgi:oligogalacturonide lyase
MDLKTGESRQVTDAAALDGSTLTLSPDERSFCFFDGPSFRQASFSSLKDREIYRVPEGWERCPGLSVAGDYSALVGESKDGRSRIRRVGMSRGVSSTVIEVPFVLCHPVARPRRSQILYRQGDEALWMVDFNGANNRKLRTPGGRIGPSLWSADGKTALYLHLPEDPTRLNAIREFVPDEGVDKMVSPTSQFVDFGPNTDGSVFVGASRNRNSPHILILLRMTRRELTLCEHRSSDPARVSPVFSPDSQSIYFQSDKHGKPALYRVHVEKFVEKTEEEAA